MLEMLYMLEILYVKNTIYVINTLCYKYHICYKYYVLHILSTSVIKSFYYFRVMKTLHGAIANYKLDV